MAEPGSHSSSCRSCLVTGIDKFPLCLGELGPASSVSGAMASRRIRNRSPRRVLWDALSSPLLHLHRLHIVAGFGAKG